jgi:hypothetical protein
MVALLYRALWAEAYRDCYTFPLTVVGFLACLRSSGILDPIVLSYFLDVLLVVEASVCKVGC